MSRNAIVMTAVLLASSTALSACARAPNPRTPEAPGHRASTSAVTREQAAVSSTAGTAPASTATVAVEALPLMVVHKSASCGCCGLWVEHMRSAGFQVEVRNSDNLNPVKERVGVPLGQGSCHTAEVGGYFVEGHVPAEDVKRLLSQKPDAKGLVLPGMPAGSPGMEMPDGRVQAYTVELVNRDGTTAAFAQHGH